tara:strand:+ start:7032 stop:7367 length:336 start_codon:yes stop_codon:yes gene_type:complete
MDLEKIKQRLLEKQAEIMLRVARTHDHIHHREEPVSADFSEQVTELEHEEIIHALDEEGRVELKRISQALQRIESGDYEFCSLCGEEIGEGRLQALPEASQCINCANASGA